LSILSSLADELCLANKQLLEENVSLKLRQSDDGPGQSTSVGKQQDKTLVNQGKGRPAWGEYTQSLEESCAALQQLSA